MNLGMLKRSAWPYRRGFTLYRKTLFGMIVGIFLIFAVLGGIYYFMFVQASKSELRTQLSLSAEALAERIEPYLDLDHILLTSKQAHSDIMFAARSSGALVWLVNSKAEIIFASGVPRHSSQVLQRNAAGLYELDDTYLNRSNNAQAAYYEDNYHELLPATEQWFSVSLPFKTGLATYAGELLLHKPTQNIHHGTIYMGNGVIIAFALAFIVAIAIIVLISNLITKPIAELSRTAEAVYRGDLSARAKCGHEQTPFLDESTARKDDDLTLLVKTMNTLISKLELQEQERQDFLTNISHDLKSPVTSIKGFVNAMLDHTIEPKDYEKYLSIVAQESERLQKLVQSLFELSLLENSHSCHKQLFDLRQLLQQSRAAFLQRWQSKGQLCHLVYAPEFDSGSAIQVLADPDLIERVVNNILLNAWRFTPAGGEIRLSVQSRQAGELVLVSVEDSGSGIAPQDLPFVFDRFFKGDKARGSQGSGLGLYIARTIIKQHGQSIEASTSSLGGAKIAFTLQTPQGRKLN